MRAASRSDGENVFTRRCDQNLLEPPLDEYVPVDNFRYVACVQPACVIKCMARRLRLFPVTGHNAGALDQKLTVLPGLYLYSRQGPPHRAGDIIFE